MTELVKIMVDEANNCLIEAAFALEKSCDEALTPKERDYNEEKWLKYASQVKILRKCLRKYDVGIEVVYKIAVYKDYSFEVKQYKVT